MKITTIKTRLLVAIMVTSALSVCMACLLHSFYDLSRYRGAKENELEQLVKYITPSLLSQLSQQDGDEPLWKSLVAENDLVQAVAVYQNNRILVDTYEREGTVIPKRLPEKGVVVTFDGDHCIYSSPVKNKGNDAGYIIIDYFLFDRGTGFRSILFVFAGNLLFATLIAYVVANGLQSRFNNAITSLVTAARSIYIDKKYKTRAVKISDDEFGLLADTMNAMLDEMSRREDEMKHLNDYLESRVETRTAALLEINSRLLKEKNRADRAASVKSDFLANMSHEIRTPMNGIVASCDLAVAEDLPPKVANYLKIIQASSHTLLLIINDILDFSKLEAGTLELERTPFSLTELLNKLSGVFREHARQRHIEFKIDVDSQTPEILVGDRVRLHQILSNLIDNGIKFTQEGSVALNIICLGKTDKDLVLECRVRDTGVGLSEESLKAIFQSFHQIDSSSTRKFGGTGLGLAITKKLAIMMGGTIEVSSRLGQGATFIVTVKMGWRPSSIQDLSRRDQFLTNQALTPVGDLAGCHALLAEDNETNRGIAEALLTDLGLTVDSVEDGEQALQSLKKTGYDFVILDMQMPVLDGYETMKQIRSQPAYQDLPIIALTAHALPGDKEKCLQAGANAYLSKPVSKNRVMEVLCGLRQVPVNTTSIVVAADHERSKGRPRSLNVEGAVRKLGVDVAIYYKVLHTFCKDYAEMEIDFFKAIDAQDIDWIQKRMHSLKGSSSTLGAEKLCDMASKLDLLSKKKQFPAAEQVRELLSELQRVIHDAEQLVAEHHPEPEECDETLTVVSADGLEEHFQALAVALDESLYDIINSEIEKIERQLTGSLVVNLGKMIQMYAYDDALVLLREICSELNMPLQDSLKG